MIDFIPIKTDTIFILTHAEAEDGTLTESGQKAAEALVDRLEPFGIDGVFCSTAAVTQATVEPLALARGLTVTVMPDLADHRLSLQGNRPDDPYLELRFKERGKARPGGERFSEAASRFGQALFSIARRPVIAPAVVTHPGLLAALLSQRDSAFGYEDYLAMPSAGVWKLTHDLGSPRIIERL